MTAHNANLWQSAAAVRCEDKKVYRLTVQREHFTFGIWTADICRALDFICEHENENIYLRIL